MHQLQELHRGLRADQVVLLPVGNFATIYEWQCIKMTPAEGPLGTNNIIGTGLPAVHAGTDGASWKGSAVKGRRPAAITGVR